MTRLDRPLPVLLLALSLGCGGTPTPTGDSGPAPGARPPKAEVRGETTLTAADLDYARPRDFTFTVANTGGSPLKLEVAHKSCSCSEVTVPPPVAPDAEGQVVVRWTPAPGSVGDLALAIDVQTNDPKNRSLRFTVHGNVQPTVHVLVGGKEDRGYVDFGDDPVPPGQKRTREATVFSTKLKEFALTPGVSPPAGFEIASTPLAPGTSFGAHDNALCGYKLEISTTNALPFGYVAAQLNLAVGKQSDGAPDRTITVPLYAVGGQGVCSVSPAEFRFSKPTLAEADTAKVRLTFFSPSGKEEVSVASVEPKFLQVDRPVKGPDGKWLVTAHLPTNNPEAARYQADPPLIGRVVLKVSGLDRPVTVRVKWEPLPK
jgi:hypothetical protein